MKRMRLKETVLTGVLLLSFGTVAAFAGQGGKPTKSTSSQPSATTSAPTKTTGAKRKHHRRHKQTKTTSMNKNVAPTKKN